MFYHYITRTLLIRTYTEGMREREAVGVKSEQYDAGKQRNLFFIYFFIFFWFLKQRLCLPFICVLCILFSTLFIHIPCPYSFVGSSEIKTEMERNRQNKSKNIQREHEILRVNGIKNCQRQNEAEANATTAAMKYLEYYYVSRSSESSYHYYGAIVHI